MPAKPKTAKVTAVNDLKVNLVIPLIAAIIGIAAGYMYIFLRASLGFLQNIFLQNQIAFTPIGYENHILGYWFLVLPPIAFVFIAAFIKVFDADSFGAALPGILQSEANNKQYSFTWRGIFVRGFAAVFTIASGGSVGKEGPLAYMAASLSQKITNIIRLDKDQKRLLLICGIAAGISASLNTPLAAIVLALELFLKKLRIESFFPILISSFFACLVARATYGQSLEFLIPTFHLQSSLEIVFYIGLGLIAGLYSSAIKQIYKGIYQGFAKTNIHYLWKALFGGLIISAFGFFFPQSLGLGVNTLVESLRGQTLATVVLALFFAKPILMAVSLHCGGSGGLIWPLLFIGALMGATYGIGLQHYFPTIVLNYGPYALVGMAAFFAATSRASFSAAVLLIELTLDYSLILPLILACIIAEQIAILLKSPSIFLLPIKSKDKN